MGIEQLTPERMRHIAEIARDPEVCRPFESGGRIVWDDWCASAAQSIEEYLASEGIDAVGYFPDFEEQGGIPIDRSHVWVVLMDDGTIIDASITQYLSGSSEQMDTVSGYPHDPRWPDIAVMTAEDPFVKKMGYESHTTGNGWASPKPAWFQKLKMSRGREKRSNPMHRAIFIRYLGYREWLPEGMEQRWIDEMPTGDNPYRTLWKLDPPIQHKAYKLFGVLDIDASVDPEYVVITGPRPGDDQVIVFPAHEDGSWSNPEIAEMRGATKPEDMLQDMGYVAVGRTPVRHLRVVNPHHAALAARLARGL